MGRSTISELEYNFAENGTGIVEAVFRDEAGQLVVPKSATWTLTDEDGDVKNAREDVAISPLDSTVSIVLAGDDLALSTGFSGVAEKRIILIRAVYDSTDYGNDLPLNQQVIFCIDNLAAI